MTAEMPRLDVRNLNKRFGNTLAVDGVSFGVERGRVTCLLGPSGCGKSTTLRIIAGVETEDSGAITVDGQSLTGRPPEHRGIGLMFQDFALFPHLKVGDNVAYGLKNRRAAGPRVAELLSRVGLSKYIDDYPHVLSGGEQQRIALIRALAPRPSVMLMDEPFSGLDERLRDTVRDETLSVLRDEDAAVLLVTHDPTEAMRMGDTIALMRKGRIAQHGTPNEVYMAPRDMQTASFFSDINVFSSRVQSGSVMCPFGTVAFGAVEDGAKVQVAVRTQHVMISAEGAPATVTRSRFLGLYSHVECQLQTDETVTMLLPDARPPAPGDKIMLRAAPEHIMVFPA